MRIILTLCALFLCVACKNDISARKKIALLPLGKTDNKFLSQTKNAIEKYYGMDVLILSALPLPEQAFVSVKSPRYRADSILSFLNKIKPDTIDYIMGITEVDISTTKTDASGKIKKPEAKYADWGIMGLAYRPGVACVISTFRIKSNDTLLLKQRLEKIALHEFGHNLGLPHCPNSFCVMTSANETISTIDKEKADLCRACKSRIGVQ